MKQLAAGLQAHLDTGATTLAMCWKIARTDGEVFGFTEHDKALTFDGVTYAAERAFNRTQISQTLGLSVDNHDVMGAIDNTVLTEDSVTEGRWDGAEVTVMLVNWQDTTMRQVLYRGQLGQTTRGDVAFRTEVRSLVDRLSQKTGRVFGFYCDADLGDARCGFDLTDPDFKATGTIGASPTARTMVLSGVAGFDAGWFSGGKITMTSGALDGLSREVKTHSLTGSVHSADLWEAFPAAPAPGDSFEVTAGCDKTWSTCRAKFANGDNFRGFPHMPGNDRVTDYPRQGELMDGSSLFPPEDE
jgi:uncharacterized phage protein (TIGR02218 family)